MANQAGFQVHALNITIRFIQGYRYLDRCGEALVKLENVLHKGWIPTTPTPVSCSLRNDQLGMIVNLNAEAMTVGQTEFIAFDHFRDQTCKIYDTVWPLFAISRINVPAVQIILQKGVGEEQLDEANEYLMSLALCSPRKEFVSLVGGTQTALDFTLITTGEVARACAPSYRRFGDQTRETAAIRRTLAETESPAWKSPERGDCCVDEA